MIYKVPQIEIDTANKNRVLGIIRYYSFMDGGLDLSKIDPKILIQVHGLKISLAEAGVFVQELISEGKVEEVI